MFKDKEYFESAVQKKAHDIDKLRRQAAIFGDAFNYYKYCEQGGFKPEEQYLSLYLEGMAEAEKQDMGDLEKRAEFEKNFEFITKADKRGLDPDKEFEDISGKYKLIKEVKGYTKLKRRKIHPKESKPREPINGSSNAKLGKAFKNIYYSALKKINRGFS